MSPKRLPILTVDIAIANAILEPIVAKNIKKKKEKPLKTKQKTHYTHDFLKNIHNFQKSSCQLSRECVYVGQTHRELFLSSMYFTICYIINTFQVSLSS